MIQETVGEDAGTNAVPAGIRAVTSVPTALADGKRAHATADKHSRQFVNDGGMSTVYQDATGTPVVSPKTSLGTTPVALAIPTGARTLWLTPLATIRYGSNATLDGTANEGYDIVFAGTTSPPIPVVDGTAIYIRIDASSGTTSCYFHFDK